MPNWQDHLTRAGIDTRTVTYDGQPVHLLAAVGELDLMIGMRLHACVFSYVAGVQFAPVPCHTKVADFADDGGLPPELRLPNDGSCSKRTRTEIVDVVERDDAFPRLMPLSDAIARARLAFDTSIVQPTS